VNNTHAPGELYTDVELPPAYSPKNDPDNESTYESIDGDEGKQTYDDIDSVVNRRYAPLQYFQRRLSNESLYPSGVNRYVVAAASNYNATMELGV
jgi:hypothetical protein